MMKPRLDSLTKQPEYTYDVFISYSQADRDWVEVSLIPSLQQARLNISTADRHFKPGYSKSDNNESAVAQSRKILLVLTPDWLNDTWATFQSLLAQTEDSSGRLPRVLPLLLKPCDLPRRLEILTYADFTDPKAHETQMPRLVQVLEPKTRVFISYKPAIQPDERLARQLAQRLRTTNLSVYIDDQNHVDLEWANEIQCQIEASDFFIVLLSGASVQSETVAKEIEYAHEHFESTGRPLLLPVQIKYRDTLPAHLGPFINNLRSVDWLGRIRNIVLVTRQLIDLIGALLLQRDSLSSTDRVSAEPVLTSPADSLTAEPAPEQPPAVDAYTPYEQGVQLLIDRIGARKAEYQYALALQEQLRENTTMARLYGDTEERRTEREDIIGRLNTLASVALHVPFSRLSGLSIPAEAHAPTEDIPMPEPSADPRPIDSLSTPGGAIQFDSRVYIERTGDVRLRNELSKDYGTTTTIRAPRQTGKSSMLLRGVAFAQQRKSKAIFIDLQLIEKRHLTTIDTFLHHIARVIGKKLSLDLTEVDKRWQSNYDFGAMESMTYLMEEYILPQASERGKKVALAIDEADRLIDTSFHDEFFGMLRAWHNQRAINDIWNGLDLLMVISTESRLLIKSQNQSPFNVGQRIYLEDFDESQVMQLIECYGLPIENQDIHLLIEFLSGHPYLTLQALYTLRTEKVTCEQLIHGVIDERGPFGDHMSRYLWILRNQAHLQESLKQVIMGQGCKDELSFHQLSQAGLIKGTTPTNCTCRCKLYELYFVGKLP